MTNKQGRLFPKRPEYVEELDAMKREAMSKANEEIRKKKEECQELLQEVGYDLKDEDVERFREGTPISSLTPSEESKSQTSVEVKQRRKRKCQRPLRVYVPIRHADEPKKTRKKTIVNLCHRFEEAETTPKKTKVLKKSEKLEASFPFTLHKVFGYDFQVFIHNLTTVYQNEFLFACGQFAVIYDYENGTHKTLQGHSNRIVCLSADATGRWLASTDVGEDNCIIIWDALHCQPVHTIFDFSKYGCNYIVLSHCAKYLVTVTEDNSQDDDENSLIISVWEWVHGKTKPDASIYLDTQEYGPLRCIKFCYIQCEFLMVTTEKYVIFLNFDVEDGQTVFTYYTPKCVKSWKDVGCYTDSTYVSGSHLAASVSTSGHVSLWSDVAWDFYSDEPERPLSNYKDGYIQIRLSDVPVNIIDSVDKMIVTVDTDGLINLYDRKFRLMHCCNYDIGSIVHLSLHLKQRKECKKERVISCDDEKEDSTEFKAASANQERVNKVDEWELAEPTFDMNDGYQYDFRDFLVTTDCGDIFYINYSKTDPYYVIENFYPDPTAIEIHPAWPYLLVGSSTGCLYLIDYSLNDLILYKELRVKSESAGVLMKISDDEEDEWGFEKPHLNYIKYSPDGLTLACGTLDGKVLFLTPLRLKLLLTLVRSASAIQKIIYSFNSKYMAYCDEDGHIILVLVYNEVEFIGRIRAHAKKITDLIFLMKKDRLFLYSIGEDKILVEYNVEKCHADKTLTYSVYIRLEQTAIPVALQFSLTYPRLLIIFTNENKCRYLDTNTMSMIATLQAPIVEYPIKNLQYLHNDSEQEYIYFESEDEIGLIKCPLNGNPYKWGCIHATTDKIIRSCILSCGRFVFTLGKNETFIYLWEIRTEVIDALARLGGTGFEPYTALLDPRLNSPSLEEIKDYFFFSQIVHKGRYSSSTRHVSNCVSFCEIPDLIRALGFFPTDFELEMLLSEALPFRPTGSNLEKLSKQHILFEEFLHLYLSYRKTTGITENMIEDAFKKICKKYNEELSEDEKPWIGKELFVDILENKGESFSICETYNYLRALVKPLTKEDERKLLTKDPGTNKDQINKEKEIYDFLPKIITYDYLVKDILGMKESLLNSQKESLAASPEEVAEDDPSG